jgi:hypothetical protein
MVLASPILTQHRIYSNSSKPTQTNVFTDPTEAFVLVQRLAKLLAKIHSHLLLSNQPPQTPRTTIPATMPSKATKRPALTIDTSVPKTKPEIPDTDASDTNAPQEHTHQPCNSTAYPTTQEHHHHQHDHRQHDHADAESLKSTSTASFDSDLTSWALLSVDGPTGGTLRTICTRDREDGEPCQHLGHELNYAAFPRVDEPFEEITMEEVKAMEEEDEQEWVVI